MTRNPGRAAAKDSLEERLAAAEKEIHHANWSLRGALVWAVLGDTPGQLQPAVVAVLEHVALLTSLLEDKRVELAAARSQCAEHQRGENAALNLLQEAREEVEAWSEDRLADGGVDDQFADLAIRLEKFLEPEGSR